MFVSVGTLTRRHSRRKSSISTDDSSSGGTLKRQHSFKSRGSIESMSGRNGNATPLCGTPVRERSSPFRERDKVSPSHERPPSVGSVRSPMDMPASMMDSITSLPPPPPPEVEEDCVNTSPSYQLPPPPPEMYNSTLSLDSLPPPPSSSDLPPVTGSELTGSQLSLMSLPPPPSENGDVLRRNGGSATPTPTQGMSPNQTPTHSRLNTPCFSPPPLSIGSNNSTPTHINPPVSFSPPPQQSPTRHHSNQPPAYQNPPPYRQTSTLPTGQPFNHANGLRSSLRQTSLPRQVSINSIASNSSGSSNGTVYGVADYPSSPKKAGKKITFNLPPVEAPALPQKPLPPRRSENTKLSSPKKLVEPPQDFLKDLQRVMRKKWQVAQKCKLEPATTPHEVLGFRDPVPLLPEYKESNVSRWVKEHYGCNNFYENVYSKNANAVAEYATSPIHIAKDSPKAEAVRNKRPPPPPPKRSETTQLSTPRIY